MRIVAIYISFCLSGVAALGYELAWTRMFATGLGHELPAILGVVTAFFGGIAIGAWLLDRPVSRSAVPGRWYAVAELITSGWALATITLIPRINDSLAGLLGTAHAPVLQWAVALVGPLVVLAPATLSMGLTLPAVDRLCGRLRHSGRSVGGLYAVNTIGAVIGILTTAHVLVPRFGYRSTVGCLAGISAISALIVLLGPAQAARGQRDVQHTIDGCPSRRRVLFLLFSTGLLGIGYEVLGVRIMGQVLENTVYSFSSALAVYLLGTAVGAALYQRFAVRVAFARVLSLLLSLLAVSCTLGIVVLSESHTLYLGARRVCGVDFGGAIAAEMLMALAAFGLPTIIMGALFSHLAQAMRQQHGGVGAALGVNTLGSALAPVVFGVLLLSAVGSKVALIIVAAAYVGLLPQIRALHIPVVVMLLLVCVVPLRLDGVAPSPGREVVAVREGPRATVVVLEETHFVPHEVRARLLLVNNDFYMGGTGKGEFLQRRQALLPLMLHPQPKRALFLGLGTGITFATSSVCEGLRADGVEMLPEVIDLMPAFGSANSAIYNTEELVVHQADARRFVRSVEHEYDVIVADLFHPARDGSGSLYTVEHFEAVRRRLADGGLFCQWLPLYQIDRDVLAVILRSFMEVFPETRAWWAYYNVQTPVLGLVGEVAPRAYPASWVEDRTVNLKLQHAAYESGLPNGLSLFGCLASSARELTAFAGPGPLNTDDHPVVSYRAPAFAYSEQHVGHGNMAALLEAADPLAADVIAAVEDHADFADLLDGYLDARDLLFKGMIALGEGRHASGEALLMDSVRASKAFDTSYVNLFLRAREQAAVNPQRAREILRELIELRPDRPQASQLLHQLGE